jgi:hypothetical protein
MIHEKYQASFFEYYQALYFILVLKMTQQHFETSQTISTKKTISKITLIIKKYY